MQRCNHWFWKFVIGISACVIGMTIIDWVSVARRSAQSAQCRANLKQIGFAIQNYFDIYGSLPPTYTSDESGNRLHSWRILITPFLGDSTVYEKYNLKKSWLSRENMALADSFESTGIQNIMACPVCRSEKVNNTDFFAVIGAGSIFGDGIPRQLTAEYIEEHGDKIILCEYNATRAHWTEPRDISIEELVHRYCSPNFTEVCKHVYNGTQSPFVHVFRLDGSTERVHLPANRSKHFC